MSPPFIAVYVQLDEHSLIIKGVTRHLTALATLLTHFKTQGVMDFPPESQKDLDFCLRSHGRRASRTVSLIVRPGLSLSFSPPLIPRSHFPLSPDRKPPLSPVKVSSKNMSKRPQRPDPDYPDSRRYLWPAIYHQGFDQIPQ